MKKIKKQIKPNSNNNRNTLNFVVIKRRINN